MIPFIIEDLSQCLIEANTVEINKGIGNVDMTIGERVKELIAEKGMTQKEFSKRTGIPQSTISDWKSKKLNPASDKIAIICEVLEIDPQLLLSGSSGVKYEKESVLLVPKGTMEYELVSAYNTLNHRYQDRLIAYAYALNDLQASDQTH